MIFDDVRADWSAMPSTNPVTLDKSKVVKFICHWEGTALPDLTNHDACLALVQSIQRYHQGTKKWADIGYTGLICPHARRIEGRGLDMVGAHTEGYNSTGWGWCWLAGPDDPITVDMYDAMHDAALICEDAAGHFLTKHGHRDFAATDCPGDEGYSWIVSGMKHSEESGMTREQYDELMARIARLEIAVDALPKTNGSSEILGTLSTLQSSVNSLTANIGTVVQASVDATLDGVEVTARYTRRKEA